MAEANSENASRTASGASEAPEKCYRVNGDFILREIAGEAILVPVGQAAERFNGMLSLNGTFCFLWKQFREPRTVREVVEAVRETFDGTEEQITKDVTDFVGESVRRGFLIEEEQKDDEADMGQTESHDGGVRS